MRLVEVRTGVTDPAARGVALGRELAPWIERAVGAYDAFWRAAGVTDAEARRVVAGAEEALRAWDPVARAELAGLARGAGVPDRAVVGLNARTEVLGRATWLEECSTAVVVGRCAPRTMQSWDWYPDLTPVGVLVEHPSPTGGVKTFTEPGALAKIGLNRAGLGLHLNILHHRADGRGEGVPVHLVAHRILREAYSLEDAVALARSAPLAASTVLTVVTWDGATSRAACLELSPDGVGVLGPDEHGFRWHTNHFLEPALAVGEMCDPTTTTWARGEHLLAQRGALVAAADAVRRAAAICGAAGRGAPVNVFCRPEDPVLDRFGTLLTAALDLEAGVLDVAPGPPADFPNGRARF